MVLKMHIRQLTYVAHRFIAPYERIFKRHPFCEWMRYDSSFVLKSFQVNLGFKKGASMYLYDKLAAPNANSNATPEIKRCSLKLEMPK